MMEELDKKLSLEEKEEWEKWLIQMTKDLESSTYGQPESESL